MSMTSLFFHALLYYESIYTTVLIPFQLFLFIYKYNSLVYSQSVVAAEVILIIIGFFLNLLRIRQGTVGNKGKQAVRFVIYFILTIIIIIGFIYLIVWQPYVYWLEFIMHIIAVIILGLEFFFSVVSLIAYQVSVWFFIFLVIYRKK